MIRTWISYLLFVCTYALAQQCPGDNVYFDLESSSSVASVRLTGHSLVANPGNGFNIAVLSSVDLHNVLSGVYAPSSSSFASDLDGVNDGDILMLAVRNDGSGLSTTTATTLIDDFGASQNIKTLAKGQGYILVARKGNASPITEQFASLSDDSTTYDPITSRVCASTLLNCPVNSGEDEVLMARSGGIMENAYSADMVIGGHYEWANCNSAGLCALVLEQDLNSRFANGSRVFTDASSFLEFIGDSTIEDSDYLVLAVHTDAADILGDSDVLDALDRWPTTASSYASGNSYVFIGRAEDSGPLSEYLSSDSAQIALQCLNTQTGPHNDPQTPAPTVAPTNSSVVPTPGVDDDQASQDDDDDTASSQVLIDIFLELHGPNLTLAIARTVKFETAMVQTIAAAVQALANIDFNVSDFQLISINSTEIPDEIGGIDTELVVQTTLDLYTQISGALDQLAGVDLSDIFNALFGNATLSSFKVVHIQSEPVPTPGGDDDGNAGGNDDGGKHNGGGNDGSGSSGVSSGDVSKWAQTTTGIVVIAVVGGVVLAAVGGGMLYKARSQRANQPAPNKASQPSDAAAMTPAAPVGENTAAPVGSAEDPEAQQAKTPE